MRIYPDPGGPKRQTSPANQATGNQNKTPDTTPRTNDKHTGPYQNTTTLDWQVLAQPPLEHNHLRAGDDRTPQERQQPLYQSLHKPDAQTVPDDSYTLNQDRPPPAMAAYVRSSRTGRTHAPFQSA